MIKNVFRFAILLVLMNSHLPAKAQFLEDNTGKPFTELKYTDIQGSPYFSDIWLTGSVKMNNGTIYKDVKLKYNQVEQLLVFQNKSGADMNFIDPVREFSMLQNGNSIIFRNGFKPAEGVTANTYYRVLADGETPLLKKTIKKIIENKEYNSATTTKKFQEINTFYLVKGNLPLKIKRDKKAFLETLGDRNTELDVFIKSNNINFKSDEDLIRLTIYYNSLK